MIRDDTDREWLAHNCSRASCLEHRRSVWTGGDNHEWRHQDGRPCEPEVTRALPGPEQAQEWSRIAQEHWQAGRLAEAAAYNHAARSADPDREPLWRARADRLLAAARTRSLAEQNRIRLAVAGISQAEASRIRDWNAQAGQHEAAS